MSVSCDTETAAVEYEGTACRLEAVFLYGLHTFVHLWALVHVVPFWLHPTHATKGYHQCCGCPQPLAPLVSPGGGLGPGCCATYASASGDFPPWQSTRTLTIFSNSLQNNTWGRSKDASTEVCPTGAHRGRGAHGYAMVPEPPQVGPENHAERHAYTHMLAKFSHHVLHTDSQLFPPTSCCLTLGCCRQASIIFSQPLFRMKWMAAAHSILTFPLQFALSLVNEARVKVRAARRASSRTGCSMVRATVAGAFPVNCTTRSRVPLMPHNKTRRTPWRP